MRSPSSVSSSGKELETIFAQIAATTSEEQGIGEMAELATLKPGIRANKFLGKQDLMLLRRQADEINAAFGESLDALVPALLARLSLKARAA